MQRWEEFYFVQNLEQLLDLLFLLFFGARSLHWRLTGQWLRGKFIGDKNRQKMPFKKHPAHEKGVDILGQPWGAVTALALAEIWRPTKIRQIRSTIHSLEFVGQCSRQKGKMSEENADKFVKCKYPTSHKPREKSAFRPDCTNLSDGFSDILGHATMRPKRKNVGAFTPGKKFLSK